MRSLSDSEMDKLIREVGEEFDEPVVGNCPDERAMIVYLVQPWGNRSPALKEHFVACRRCLNTLVKLHREFESFQQTPRSDTVPSEAWERFLADTEFRKEYEALGPEFELIESIVRRRMELKMTQGELAEKLKTGQAAISRLESGNTNPTLS